MTILELNRLVADPNLVNKSHLADLQKLIGEYPFVSTFRLLYQKGLHNEHDVICDAELRRSALFAHDRCQLMLLLADKEGKTAENTPTRDEVPAMATSHQENKLGQKVAKLSSLSLSTPQNPSDDAAAEGAELRFGAEIDAFLSHFEAAQARKKTEQSAAVDAPLKVQLAVADNDRSEDDEVPDELPNGGGTMKSNEFFTETLAKIYIKQEKFDKAINIFEQLCLNYPEKSAYFAEQIRFLRKLIKYL